MGFNDLDPVVDYTVDETTTVRELVELFGSTGGFSARKIHEASRVLLGMVEEQSTTILTFPASLVSTGLRGVLSDIVRSGFVDAVVTTCGTWDHDIARTYARYYQGSFDLDDRDLLRRGFHRLGNVLVPSHNYGPLVEEVVRPWLEELLERRKRWSTSDFSKELGRRIFESKAKGKGHSLLAACFEAEVPLFVPGPTDGAVGSQVWMVYQKDRSVGFDLLEDEQKISDLVHESSSLGALILGGGISKHHAIWWAQFRGGLDRAVYVTTAPEYDGSLSGARLEEAISWGKLRKDASFVNVEGDVTVVLPLLWAAVRPHVIRGGRRRTGRRRRALRSL